jgi:hypothetical protein
VHKELNHPSKQLPPQDPHVNYDQKITPRTQPFPSPLDVVIQDPIHAQGTGCYLEFVWHRSARRAVGQVV